MDRYLQYIAEQKRKERKQIERSTAALAELDRMERHYIKSGAAALAIHNAPARAPAQGSLQVSWEGQENPFDIVRVPHHGGTLKERVLSLIDGHPEGLVSQQILKGLRDMGYPDLKRTSVSPQLSRLRDDGTLVNDKGVWRRPKNDEAAGSADPTASQ